MEGEDLRSEPPVELREAVAALELRVAAGVVIREMGDQLGGRAKVMLAEGEARLSAVKPEIVKRAKSWIDAVGMTDVVTVVERWKFENP